MAASEYDKLSKKYGQAVQVISREKKSKGTA